MSALRLPEGAFLPAKDTGYPAPSPTSQPLCTPMNATTHADCPDAPTKKFPATEGDTCSLDPTPSAEASPMGACTPANIFPRRMSSNSSLASCPEEDGATPENFKTARAGGQSGPTPSLKLPEKALRAGDQPFFPAPSPMANSMVTPMNATTHTLCPDAPERRAFGSAGSIPSSLAPTPMHVDGTPSMGGTTPHGRLFSSGSSGSDIVSAPAPFGLPLRLPSQVFNNSSQKLPAFPAPSPQSSMLTPMNAQGLSMVTPMNATTHAVCPNAPERFYTRKAPGSLDPTPTSSASLASPAFSIMDPANIWPTSDRSMSMGSGTPIDGQAWPAPKFHSQAPSLTAQMFDSSSPKGDESMGDVTPIASMVTPMATGNSGSSRDFDWLAPILNERTPVGADDDTPMSFMHTTSNSDLNNARIMDTPQVTPASTPVSCMSGAGFKKGEVSSSSSRTPMDTQALGFFPNEAMPDNGPAMCFRNCGA